MLLGYARVSTTEQTDSLQRDALDAAGCERIWTETASGARTDRPQLADLLNHARAGDTIVVWRLDRLGRSLKHLVETINDLQTREIGLRSITESIDTSTPAGRLVLHVFASLAEFERDLIRERTSAGLAAARARGRKGGARPKLSPSQVATLKRMYDSREHTGDEIADALGVSRNTVYRYLRRAS